jgi:hypothetical protein
MTYIWALVKGNTLRVKFAFFSSMTFRKRLTKPNTLSSFGRYKRCWGTRFLALLDHMHGSARVVVTQDGLSIIVDKEAGVIQGGPASPPTFGGIMELVRWLIPPDQRPKVQLLTSVGHWEMRIELDYADDEQRVADSVEDMQICITGLLRALHTVNLEWNASKLGVLALRVNSDQSITCFDPHLTVPGPGEAGLPLLSVLLKILRLSPSMAWTLCSRTLLPVLERSSTSAG